MCGMPPGLFQSVLPRPLADQLRPANLDDVVGQDHLVGPDGSLRQWQGSGKLGSLVLWGPPGCGKTTLARLLAHGTRLKFVQLSAVMAGIAELRKVFDAAEAAARVGERTLLFIDEIHRFNKGQQDALLPHVENGLVVLVGATTENPSFELNAALLSRCAVLVLRRLDDAALELLLARAEARLGRVLPLDDDARRQLRILADGDGRYLINLAEQLCNQVPEGRSLDATAMLRMVQRRRPVYDKAGEAHYNLASALHKAVRASDVDAALYWFCRMVDGGEDAGFIARRLTRMAVEDVGLASPQALQVCVAAWQAYERLGSPEGELALAQAVVYLATAPKSNACYVALNAAMAAARTTGSLAPQAHSLNASTDLMASLGYGEGYQYDHDAPGGVSGQRHLPRELDGVQFYQPSDRGFEREIGDRLTRIRGRG